LDLVQRKGSKGETKCPTENQFLSMNTAILTYAAASWVSLVIPCSADLISFLNNDKVLSIVLPDHFNSHSHPRHTSPNDQHVCLIRTPSVFNGWRRVTISHGGLLKVSVNFDNDFHQQQVCSRIRSPGIDQLECML
jgi:hypothetical protein